MFKKILLSLAFSLAALPCAPAASIVWGAGQDNGFSLFSGAELAISNLVRLGYFDISDSTIQANATNVTFLNSHFVEIDHGRIGDGNINAPSNLSVGHDNLDTSAVAGQQMYLWAFASGDNSSVANSISSATEIGIFYVDKSLDSRWAFPVETPVPGATSIDLSDLTNGAGTALIANGAHILVGSFPKGASTLGGAPNFGLLPVPEPASALLAAASAVIVLGFRRRRL